VYGAKKPETAAGKLNGRRRSSTRSCLFLISALALRSKFTRYRVLFSRSSYKPAARLKPSGSRDWSNSDFCDDQQGRVLLFQMNLTQIRLGSRIRFRGDRAPHFL